jgi:apolipoprotein N-acyltransferase
VTGLGVSVAATVLSGILYALAFPPVRAHVLAWVALVPLLLVLRDAGWKRRLGLGVLWTFVSGWSVGTWMVSAVASYFSQPLAVGLVIFLIVTGLMAAPYYAAFAVASAPLLRWGPASPLMVGAAWAAAELARGRLLNGTLAYVGNSPWATLGYSQAGVPPVLQIASLTGVYGVSFLVAIVNAGIAEVIASRRHGNARAAWLGLGIAASIAIVAAGWGTLVIRSNDATAPPTTTVAVVQGNIGAAVRWSAEGPARTLETYQRLTRDLLPHTPASIVFWPEAAITAFVEQDDVSRRALGATLGASGGELLVGAPRAGTADGGPPYTNSYYVVGADGVLDGRYDKEFLLPFMEYFPLRLDFARRQFGRVREFSFGTATAPLRTAAGTAGVLICNEAFLPHVAGARVAAGATYLVSPSNDSWVPHAGFAWQQFDIATLRAVEQRRWLVRVSDSGPSGLVDPFGRVTLHTEPLTRDTLVGSIAARAERSPYGRWGDVFGFACVIVTLMGLAAQRTRI